MEIAFEDLCSRFDRYLHRLRASGDTQYFDRIAAKFDAEDGIVHGLAHKELANPNCMCIACLSRRTGEPRNP